MEARGYAFIGWPKSNTIRFRDAELTEDQIEVGDDYRPPLVALGKPRGGVVTPPLERDERLLRNSTAVDLTIPEGRCTVWTTDQRLLWRLDKRPEDMLDVRFADFKGLGVNHDLRQLAAEVRWKPWTWGDHIVYPPAHSVYVG
jgi:hypothetical protein